MSDDPELETFLRQFRPRPPVPLSRPRRRSVRLWWLVTAAAMLITITWWERSPQSPRLLPAQVVSSHPRRATLGAFRVSVRSGTYEALLDDLDVVLLPDPTRQGGALQSLADVSRDR